MVVPTGDAPGAVAVTVTVVMPVGRSSGWLGSDSVSSSEPAPPVHAPATRHATRHDARQRTAPMGRSHATRRAAVPTTTRNTTDYPSRRSPREPNVIVVGIARRVRIGALQPGMENGGHTGPTARAGSEPAPGVRPLPARPAPVARRHGRDLPRQARPRRASRSSCVIKKVLPAPRRGRGVHLAVRRRGPGRHQAPARQRRPGLRGRPRRRRVLPRARVRRGPRPAPHPARCSASASERLPVDLALFIGREVANGLAYAHRRTDARRRVAQPRPLRHLAAQRDGVVRGRDQDHRLRHRQERDARAPRPTPRWASASSATWRPSS